jgi:hypothetical protein
MLYSIVNDTLNGLVNAEKLSKDFEDNNLSYDKFVIKGDSLEVYSGEPEASITSLINAHDGSPLPYPRILDLFDENFDGKGFRDLDYTIKGLYPKRTFSQGELQLVEWYLEPTFDTMVLNTTINYTRDAYGFATSRTTVRRWCNTDGSYNPLIKTKTKYYTALEMIKEGKRRRGNIVDGVQLPVFSFLQEAANDPTAAATYGLNPATVLLVGREFMDRFDLEFGKFTDNSSSITDINDPNFNRKTVVVAFEEAANTTDSWLNYQPMALGGATILQYLVGEFSI